MELESSGNSQTWNCLGEAFGFDDIKNIRRIILGTKNLMTARTLLSIGKALEKRYLGYLGLMYSAYEFAICMKQKDDHPSYPFVFPIPDSEKYPDYDICKDTVDIP